MRIRHIYQILFSCIAIILTISCNSDNEYTVSELSKDAQIYSFSLTAAPVTSEDTVNFAVLGSTRFSILQTGQREGLIYNPEPLPYKTTLKNYLPAMTFTGGSTSLGVEITYLDNDSTFTWSTTDSIDFSRNLQIAITPLAGSDYKKIYEVEIRVYQHDPDSIIWTPQTQLPQTGVNKSLNIDNTLYSFINNSGTISLAKKDLSNESSNWATTSTSGLPSDVKLNNLTYANGFFAVSNEAKSLYKSIDGATWTQATTSYPIIAVLGSLPKRANDTSTDDDILLIVENAGGNYFATTKDLDNPVIASVSGNQLQSVPDNFPLTNFSAITYQNESNRFNNQLIIVGGTDKDNNKRNTTWLISNSSAENTIEYTSNGNRIDNILGINEETGSVNADDITIFWYNKKLWAFAQGALYTSDDFGIQWTASADKQNPQSGFSAQKGRSTLVDNNNYIWIIGGDNSNLVLKGKLNSFLPWNQVIN